MLDAKRGDTVETFIKEYAPSNENDTESYIEHMVKELGVKRNTPLKEIIDTQGVENVAKAIAKKEDHNFFKDTIIPLIESTKSTKSTEKYQIPTTSVKPTVKPVAKPTVKPKYVPVAKKDETSFIDEAANVLQSAVSSAKRELESVPGMLSRAWVKYGFGDAAKSETDTVPNRITTIPVAANKPNTTTETKSNIVNIPIINSYKEFGTTKEGYYSYINIFDNSKGFNYVPTTRIEKDSTYSNVQGMAHFLFDYDMTSEKPADKSNTASLHRNIKYNKDGSINIDSLKAHRTNQPGSSVKDRYYTIYNKNQDGTVNIKYKKADEIKKGDKIGDDLRQYRFTDINWNSGVQAPNFNKTIQTLSTKDNQPTYFIFAKGLGKNAYGKYGGGSVVFLVEGTNIAIDFAGSINQIKTQGLEIINQFKIDPKQLIVAYHDVGSYSAKPDDVNNKIDSRRYYNFNTNKQTGAGIAIPKN